MNASGESYGIEGAVVPSGHVFATPPSYDRERHARHVTLAAGLVAVLFFFYLETVVGSPLLPGTWTQFQPAFLVDLLFALATLGTITLLPQVDPVLTNRLVLQPAGVSTGLLTAGLFLVGGLVLGTGYLALNGVLIPVGTVDSTVALQATIEFAVFVAIGEELFFRVALTCFVRDQRIAAFTGSAPFALYHIWAYSTGPNGTVEPASVILGSLAFAALFGLLLWAVYKLWGILASIGLHGGWDVAVSSTAALHVTKFLALYGVHLTTI